MTIRDGRRRWNDPKPEPTGHCDVCHAELTTPAARQHRHCPTCWFFRNADHGWVEL